MLKAICNRPTCTNMELTNRHHSFWMVSTPRLPPQPVIEATSGRMGSAPLNVIARYTNTQIPTIARVTINRGVCS